MIDLNALLAPLRNRVINMVTRAVVNLVDDSHKLQEVRVSGVEDDILEDVERFQNYGFTSVPKDGAEAIVLRLGGRGDHPVVIAVDDRRFRIGNLESGEVAVYTDQGDSIVIRRGGTVEITSATKVKLTTPVVELAGNTQAAVLGNAYRTAETTYLDAIVVGVQAALTALGLGAAGTTLAGARTAFNGAASTYLSSKVKLS